MFFHGHHLDYYVHPITFVRFVMQKETLQLSHLTKQHKGVRVSTDQTLMNEVLYIKRVENTFNH